MPPEPLTVFDLSSRTFHFLARRDIVTVAQLCAKSPRELLWVEKWLTDVEKWNRRVIAGGVLFETGLREIQHALAAYGLCLRDGFPWSKDRVEQK